MKELFLRISEIKKNQTTKDKLTKENHKKFNNQVDSEKTWRIGKKNMKYSG